MDYYKPENVLLQQRYKRLSLFDEFKIMSLSKKLEIIDSKNFYNSITIEKVDENYLKTRNEREGIDYVIKKELDRVNIIYGANNRPQFINILPLSKQNQSTTSTNRPIVVKLYTELDSSLKKRIFEKWLEDLMRKFRVQNKDVKFGRSNYKFPTIHVWVDPKYMTKKIYLIFWKKLTYGFKKTIYRNYYHLNIVYGDSDRKFRQKFKHKYDINIFVTQIPDANLIHDGFGNAHDWGMTYPNAKTPIWVNAYPASKSFIAFTTLHEITHRISFFAGIWDMGDSEHHDKEIGLSANGEAMRSSGIEKMNIEKINNEGFLKIGNETRRFVILKFLFLYLNV